MKIGRLPECAGQVNVGKWYIGVEILRYHPACYYDGFALKPYFVFMFTKIIDYGEPYKIEGREMNKIGGWCRFEFPVGIFIKINLI